VITDPDLADAVADRAGWEPVGERAARYASVGMPLTVLVQAVLHPRRRERYAVTVQRGRDAVHSRPFARATDAVRYAERIPLVDS